jgi:hypothetical protein
LEAIVGGSVQPFKSAVCPLKTLHTDGQRFERHPIRWNNRPVSGRLIVYSVSSFLDKKQGDDGRFEAARTKVVHAVDDRVVEYSGQAIA